MNTPSDLNSAFGLDTREDRPTTIVLACGLATTALALLGVYILNAATEDFHIMGWYANYILPVGAMLVGFVASSGYGLASWITGTKITRRLLWTVLLLQFVAYFVAQYIEFRSLLLFHPDGSPVGFIEYYDYMARTFAWKQRNGGPGAPLGVWGYAFRGLEVLGFVGGSLLAPAALRKTPYCEACQRYMKTKELISWAANIHVKKVKKTGLITTTAYENQVDPDLAREDETWVALKQAISASQAADFREKISSLQPEKKAAKKTAQYFTLTQVSCRRCCCGWLRLDLTIGKGREIEKISLEQVPAPAEFIFAINAPANPFQGLMR